MPKPIEVGAVGARERVQGLSFRLLRHDIVKKCAERGTRKLNARIRNRLHYCLGVELGSDRCSCLIEHLKRVPLILKFALRTLSLR